ncbi:protein phosphatase 2C domain-containing protein [Oleidesulfovibrio sp.]|uniref:protein phosphatase 2C domain-containing protein n=1 Tax=Oleidesulfovibrio sp. TaxID=2909707 RepID=UPI003A86ECD3
MMDTKERFSAPFFIQSKKAINTLTKHQAFQCDNPPKLHYASMMSQAAPLQTGIPQRSEPLCSEVFSHTACTVYQTGSTGINEDRLFASAPLYAVVDGASSLVDTLYNGRTGAEQAAQCIYKEFSAYYQDRVRNKKHLPLSQAAHSANSLLAEHMLSYGINCKTADPKQRLRLWSASAAAVWINDSHAEWMQIGDSQIVFIKNGGSWYMPAKNADHDRQTMIHWKELSQQGITDIRTALKSDIESVRLQMNRTFGVLNGEQAMSSFLQTGAVPLNDIAHILIFTDGLTMPCAEPRQGTDYTALCDAYLRGGLSELHNTITQIQASDPACTMYPRFKCHDDTAAIALSVSSENKR